MAATTISAKYEKLIDAYQAFARENGDGFSSRDYDGATGYREEGYRLGEEAADLCEEDRDEWIEGESYAFPESARYLVAVAADYRLAELEANAVSAAPERRAAA